MYRIVRHVKCGDDRFVLIGLQKIHYLEAGKGEPVILLPGSYTTHRVWNHLIPLLKDDFQLLALDYPAESDFSIREQSDLVARMVQQLKLGKVNLIGGLQNGVVVFDFACRYPDLTGKIVSFGGDILSLVKPRGNSKTKEKKENSRQAVLKPEDIKALKAPVLYLFGAKTNKTDSPLAKNLEFIQQNLPSTWIMALEGGIFETALKTPQEVSSLIQTFLKAKE